jgi:uncharacterized protein (TIGR04255 family)
MLNYQKAPITEALIDLRVELSSQIEPSILRQIQDSVSSIYPGCEALIDLEQQIQAGSGVTATASQTHIGYRFLSGDRKHIFQARLDGFTFSRLAPYGEWKIFRDEARCLWELYRAIAKPKTINRVAVRYINLLNLPLPLNDFRDYLRTVPEVSPDLPQGLRDYFMQLQIPQEDLEGMLLLNEAIIPSSADNVVSVLLDIDLFCNVNFSSDEDRCWSLLEKLRLRKNEVFEACITDKARELFK